LFQNGYLQFALSSTKFGAQNLPIRGKEFLF
jgi:hypothetical protein